MEKININKDYEQSNGAQQYYTMHNFENLKYTDGVREIIIKHYIQHLIIPLISLHYKSFDQTLQVWKFERSYYGETPTNEFLLTCETECPHLLEIEAENPIKLDFVFRFYHLYDTKFDTLKMFLIDGVLLLPEEY